MATPAGNILVQVGTALTELGTLLDSLKADRDTLKASVATLQTTISRMQLDQESDRVAAADILKTVQAAVTKLKPPTP